MLSTSTCTRTMSRQALAGPSSCLGFVRMALLAFIRPRAWRLQGTAHGLRGFSLRFREAWQEQGFVQSRADELRVNLLYCCVTALLIFAGAVAFTFLAGWHDPSSYASQEGLRYNTIQMAALGVSAFICMVLAVVAKTTRVARMIGPVGLELSVPASHDAFQRSLTGGSVPSRKRGTL